MDDKETKGTPPGKEKKEDSSIAIFFIALMIVAFALMIIYFIVT